MLSIQAEQVCAHNEFPEDDGDDEELEAEVEEARVDAVSDVEPLFKLCESTESVCLSSSDSSSSL